MGKSRPIEIIAELGINHQGDMKIFEEMACIAKDCGADTIKSQLYDPKKLLNPKDFSDEDWQVILASELSPENLFFIKELCDDLKMDLLFSVFDLERLGWLEKLGIERYKIASRSVFDEELCKAILETRKPILVSDGYLPSYRPWPWIGRSWLLNLDWLYCMSKYPAELDDIDTREMRRCLENPIYVGFSDHTIGISAALFAMANRARIIEKHFTLDRSFPGPDHRCSALPEELRRLCEYRDDFERILGKA